MFVIGVNSVWWTIAPGGYSSQDVTVPACDYLNAIVAHLLVRLDNTANTEECTVAIMPPGPDTGMPNYCHGVPAFPVTVTVPDGAQIAVTLPELFATAADYTVKPPTEVPQPPFAKNSYSRGVKNLGKVPIKAMIAIAGMGCPIDWAGTTAPWFTWGRG
ncbi:MAG TPA: hypothetical protein VGI65_00695 [Steroidobacteraceae bacterium]|jgi:hypothetical protein